MRRLYNENDMKKAAKKAVFDYICNDHGGTGSSMEGTSFHGGLDYSFKTYRSTNIDGWWNRNKKLFNK